MHVIFDAREVQMLSFEFEFEFEFDIPNNATFSGNIFSSGISTSAKPHLIPFVMV